eukprot:m.219635 g.219635  ORF g.219635 m.219635 type:complete len:194 (+) comp10208_c0_seq1:45-626(+)
MKTLLTTAYVTIPDGVQIEVKSRNIRVKGPRGTLTREFKHLNLELALVGKNKLRVDSWFAKRKEVACVRTLCSHIENMITGVTKGFQYKMRSVYAHFPINMTVPADGKSIDIRNFLGEKMLRQVQMHNGVKVEMSKAQKDEIVLEGNDLEKLSMSAALVHQAVLVKNKDIRKFLDGLYVSERNVLESADAGKK